MAATLIAIWFASLIQIGFGVLIWLVQFSFSHTAGQPNTYLCRIVGDQQHSLKYDRRKTLRNCPRIRTHYNVQNASGVVQTLLPASVLHMRLQSLSIVIFP